MHVVIDATYEGQPLAPFELCDLGKRLAYEIGMTPMGNAHVEGESHEWGPSMIQGLQESHWALHYMVPNTVAIDIFSCKPFDDRRALVWLWDRLSLRRLLSYRLIERHSDLFPKRG